MADFLQKVGKLAYIVGSNWCRQSKAPHCKNRTPKCSTTTVHLSQAVARHLSKKLVSSASHKMFACSTAKVSQLQLEVFHNVRAQPVDFTPLINDYHQGVSKLVEQATSLLRDVAGLPRPLAQLTWHYAESHDAVLSSKKATNSFAVTFAAPSWREPVAVLPLKVSVKSFVGSFDAKQTAAALAALARVPEGSVRLLTPSAIEPNDSLAPIAMTQPIVEISYRGERKDSVAETIEQAKRLDKSMPPWLELEEPPSDSVTVSAFRGMAGRPFTVDQRYGLQHLTSDALTSQLSRFERSCMISHLLREQFA